MPAARLHAEMLSAAPGRPEQPRLVLVHGFTQTGRSWEGIAERLAARGHEVMLVDAPGHGGSAHIAADLPTGALLLGEVGGKAAYVGYSMGARLCLHLALAQPERVERLVLLGATAGIEDPAARAARREADEALAATLDPPGRARPDPPGGASGDGTPDDRRLDAFLDAWLAKPLFTTLASHAARLDDRRRNSPAGLASSLRLAGTGTQQPLWGRLPTLGMPTLVMAGALDTTFAAHAARMAAAIGPNATVALVPGAGHAAHLEDAGAFLEAVLGFVDGDPGSNGRGGGSRGGAAQDFCRK